MSVSKVPKGAEPVSETYVADLYGDVEYMCGSSVVKVRNTLVRQGAGRRARLHRGAPEPDKTGVGFGRPRHHDGGGGREVRLRRERPWKK